MYWQNMAPNYQIYWPTTQNIPEIYPPNQNFMMVPYAPKI